MSIKSIERNFEAIGARLKTRVARSLRVDIRRDGKGQYFDLALPTDAAEDARVVDVQPRNRHLLLLLPDSGVKHKFLCGHDEREWFAAAVPGRNGVSVSSVFTAMEALKPLAVRQAQDAMRVPHARRSRRKTAAYLRQGEWFLLPEPNRAFDEKLILRNEPLRRGNNKPHYAEQLVRSGGEVVYVGHGYPNGLTERQYKALLERRPKLRQARWFTMIRDPAVFIRGKLRHPDHKTLELCFWHRVLPNSESEAGSRSHLAFLD